MAFKDPQFVVSEIPSSHYAAVSEKVGQYPLIKQVDTPDVAKLRPGQALVKLCYSGVCHSDVSLALGKGTHRPMEPCISGHEGTGFVVGIGEQLLPGKGVQIGDRVGVKFVAETCMRCEACEGGQENVCNSPKISGINSPGTFQQYIVASTLHLTPIPDNVPLAVAAPILCAGLTSYKALLSANLRPGDWVVIPGAGGGLGHLAVQYALAMNFRCVAIDSGEDKRKLLESYGVHVWLDFKVTEDITSAIMNVTKGAGAKAAIVTAGSIGPYQEALKYLGNRSTLVCVGLPHHSIFQVDAVQLVLKSSKIVASSVGTRAEAKEALDFVSLGKIKVEVEVRKLREVEEVFKELEAGKVRGRVVLDLAEV